MNLTVYHNDIKIRFCKTEYDIALFHYTYFEIGASFSKFLFTLANYRLKKNSYENMEVISSDE